MGDFNLANLTNLLSLPGVTSLLAQSLSGGTLPPQQPALPQQQQQPQQPPLPASAQDSHQDTHGKGGKGIKGGKWGDRDSFRGDRDRDHGGFGRDRRDRGGFPRDERDREPRYGRGGGYRDSYRDSYRDGYRGGGDGYRGGGGGGGDYHSGDRDQRDYRGAAIGGSGPGVGGGGERDRDNRDYRGAAIGGSAGAGISNDRDRDWDGPKPVCRHFLRGICNFADGCRFSHDQKVIEAALASGEIRDSDFKPDPRDLPPPRYGGKGGGGGDRSRPKEDGRVHLWNLPSQWEAVDVRRFFDQFGTVIDASIMHGCEGKGAVTFQDMTVADEIVDKMPDLPPVEGCYLRARLASDRKPSVVPGTRVHLWGLPVTWDVKDIKQYFTQFGRVMEASLLRTGDGKGSVTFAEPSTANEVVRRAPTLPAIQGSFLRARHAGDVGRRRDEPGTLPPSAEASRRGFPPRAADTPHHAPPKAQAGFVPATEQEQDPVSAKELQEVIELLKNSPNHDAQLLATLQAQLDQQLRVEAASSTGVPATPAVPQETPDVVYLLAKVESNEDLTLSVERDKWHVSAMQAQNFNQLFRAARKVVFIFSVRGSNAFCGFADVQTEAMQRSTHTDEQVRNLPASWEWVMGVQWKSVSSVSFDRCPSSATTAGGGERLPENDGARLVTLIEQEATRLAMMQSAVAAAAAAPASFGSEGFSGNAALAD